MPGRKIEQSGTIEVRRPLPDVWKVCDALHRFPDFIGGIHSATDLGDGRFHWTGRAFGMRREWTSRTIERIEPVLLAWQTDQPMVPDGKVELQAIDDRSTSVSITMRYEPQSLVDRIVASRAIARLRLWLDLHAFRHHVERITHH